MDGTRMIGFLEDTSDKRGGAPQRLPQPFSFEGNPAGGRMASGDLERSTSAPPEWDTFAGPMSHGHAPPQRFVNRSGSGEDHFLRAPQASQGLARDNFMMNGQIGERRVGQEC